MRDRAYGGSEDSFGDQQTAARGEGVHAPMKDHTPPGSMKLTYAYLAAHHPRPNHIFAQGIVCLLLIFSSAGNAAQSGDFTYNVLNSTVTITGYTGGGGNVAIPDTIAEMPVAMIGERAFLSCKTLTDITLPASLTSIGALAFASCSGLTSLTLPENVTSIGVGAFRSCSGLRNITVATLNPRYIDRDGVLFNKDETTLILYPAGRAGRYEIPNTVSSIGDEAFMNCHWLTSVTLPASLTTIGSGVFVQCNDLTNLTVDAFNPNYSERDGVVFNKDHATLVQYPPGREGRYDVPDGVMGIGDWAFSSFYLTSITLPESLTSIGAYAFYNSGGLTSITLPANVTSIGSGAFWFCSGLTSITLPDSVNGIGSHAFAGCSGLTNIAFGNRLTSIDSYAFVGCLRLTAIALPDSVTSVGDGAFYGCSALASVTLPNSVTSIGYESFSGCARLDERNFAQDCRSHWGLGLLVLQGDHRSVFCGQRPNTRGGRVSV